METLDRIDWNLVPALHALLTERSVTRAAKRLGISQPAASGALGRLRRHFDDELLHRDGNGYSLTPLASRLAPLAAGAMDATQNILASADTFTPSTSTREFVIASSEYGQTVIGPHLMPCIASDAPGVRIVFRWPWTSTATPAEWLNDVDGWIAPRGALTDMPSSGLLPDRWVCIVDSSNTRVGESITLDEITNLSWVLPTTPRDRHVPWVRRLQSYGLDQTNIAATTESFSAIPHLVNGTDRVGIIQSHLAHRLLGSSHDYRMLSCPIEMTPLGFTMWWHPNREHDAGHRWLRDSVTSALVLAADET